MAMAALLACAPAIQPEIPDQSELQSKLQIREQEALERQNRTRQVRYLLASAELALQRDRLMVPKSDNAFDWYQQVLAIDEANTDAHQGMQRITARYMALARESFERGLVEQGERMLWGAAQVSATPGQLQLLRDEYRGRLASRPPALELKALTARGEKIQRTLAQLAIRARDKNLRLLIVARNDAEGRWIYRTMREAVAGYRLRGNIEIGTVPRVELIDL